MASAIDFRSGIGVNEYYLIRLMRRHFWVCVTAVDEYGIATTFPGADLPIPGMPIELEVHEEGGYTQFLTEVVEGPMESGGGLLLKPPRFVLSQGPRAHTRFHKTHGSASR
jgi:hypothetical protein